MKKEAVNFIAGIVIGLVISSFLSYLPIRISISDVFLNVWRSFQAKEDASQGSSIEITKQFIEPVRSRQTKLVDERPSDPRLAFLKRKPEGEKTLRADLIKAPVAYDIPISTATDEKQSTIEVANQTNRINSKKTRCATLFGSRQYLTENQKMLPPLLYTFPGSGNTWCRLLIEYATSVYTGSVYNDESLLTALPGEFTCNWRVSAIKAHPHTHRASGLLSGHFSSDANKCQRGNIKRFERAILLIRDPFDSIWSEFQRRVSKSHVSGIPRDSFNWHRWQANAANLAHAYFDMWRLDHDLIERQLQSSDYIYLKYEDLKNKATRVSTLQKIVDFLHLPQAKSLSSSQLQRKLDCAFALAENRQAHRVIDQSLYMTKDIAYKEEIACRMWNLFSSYAKKHGYSPWNHFNCSGYPKIPRINVGPQGEYDNRWVSPGQKLIDFRGKLFRNNSLILNPVSSQLEETNFRAGGQQAKKRKRPAERPQFQPVSDSHAEGTFQEIEKMILKKASQKNQNFQLRRVNKPRKPNSNKEMAKTIESKQEEDA